MYWMWPPPAHYSSSICRTQTLSSHHLYGWSIWLLLFFMDLLDFFATVFLPMKYDYTTVSSFYHKVPHGLSQMWTHQHYFRVCVKPTVSEATELNNFRCSVLTQPSNLWLSVAKQILFKGQQVDPDGPPKYHCIHAKCWFVETVHSQMRGRVDVYSKSRTLFFFCFVQGLYFATPQICSLKQLLVVMTSPYYMLTDRVIDQIYKILLPQSGLNKRRRHTVD